MSDHNGAPASEPSPASKAGGGGEGGKRRWIRDLLFWLLAGVAGFVLNEGLAWIKKKQFDDEDPVAQLAKQQKTEFDALHAGLRDLRRAVPSANRAELQRVERSIDNVQAQNRDLLRMFAMAREENDRSQELLRQSGNAGGGYDFILSENGGLRLDGHNVFGVSAISRNSVSVRLSQVGMEKEQARFLQSGESLRYTSERGQDCRISLLSISASADAASFGKVCGGTTTSGAPAT